MSKKHIDISSNEPTLISSKTTKLINKMVSSNDNPKNVILPWNEQITNIYNNYISSNLFPICIIFIIIVFFVFRYYFVIKNSEKLRDKNNIYDDDDYDDDEIKYIKKMKKINKIRKLEKMKRKNMKEKDTLTFTSESCKIIRAH